MTLYSKNGSIPYPYKDDSEGWVEVPEPPVPGEGEEVVWWCPPGWVVRPVKPDGDWTWSQSDESWVSYPVDPPELAPLPPNPAPAPMPSGNVTL